MTNTVPKIAG